MSLHEYSWGLLGTDTINISRRSRTLGVGAAIRQFNELAVPGVGNLWYGKQIYLSLLGIEVAERSGRNLSNIKVTNAIEALACALAFCYTDHKRSFRLKGFRKLHDIKDWSFKNFSRPTFYVTQPFRMGMVQPLIELGLVLPTSSRFNSFSISDDGNKFLQRMESQNPRVYRTKGVIDALLEWVIGNSNVVDSESLYDAISPLIPLPSPARNFLIRVLHHSGNVQSDDRRASIWSWMKMEYDHPQYWNWTHRPSVISEEHWKDLHGGALFTNARNKAVAVLDKIEKYMDEQNLQNLSTAKANRQSPKELKLLNIAATQFLQFNHDPTENNIATVFCEECLSSNPAIKLVERDGSGLQLANSQIVRGGAFRGNVSSLIDESEEGNAEESAELPPHISRRVHNMYHLYADLIYGY